MKKKPRKKNEIKWIIGWQLGHFGAALTFTVVAAPNWEALDMYWVYTFGFSFIILAVTGWAQ